MKRAIVAGLERVCDWTHWFMWRRPFLWLPVHTCPFARLSDRLDQRWHTEVWKAL